MILGLPLIGTRASGSAVWSSLPGTVMYEVTKASTVISHRAAVAFDCVADSQVAPLDTGIIGTFTQDSMVPSLKIS